MYRGVKFDVERMNQKSKAGDEEHVLVRFRKSCWSFREEVATEEEQAGHYYSRAELFLQLSTQVLATSRNPCQGRQK